MATPEQSRALMLADASIQQALTVSGAADRVIAVRNAWDRAENKDAFIHALAARLVLERSRLLAELLQRADERSAERGLRR